MSRLKFCKALAPLFFALVLFGLLLGLSRANAAEKNEENIFIVVDRILPILEEMGKPYEITEYDVYGDSVVGAVVYGNHVSARRVTGKYAKTWVELLDDEGVSLGFIKLSGVEPFPVASFKPSDATFYIAAKDNIDLLLMPGELDESDETDKKYRLSEYDYKIAKGELVTSYGEILFGKRGELDSSRWLLLGFETSYESGGDGGLGKRYAWARTVGFIPLNHYKPDNSKADHEWLPALMRKYNGESDTPAIPTPEALKNRLRQNGFWIDPTPIYPELLTVDDMSDLYEKTGQFEVDFITSDMFLHAYHLIFDHMLMKLEETYFIPILKKCLTNTLAGLEPLGAALTTEDGKKSYETTRDMLLIPLALLDGKDEKSGVKLSPRATEEIAKIKKAEGVEVSAIVGANIDYTQFLPRGHYTTSPALERYFGAMSFLGNAGLALFEADGEPNLQNLKIAALLTLALGKYGDDWKSFETPINFLVGEPDDGGLVAYQKSVQSAIGGVEQVKNIEDDGKIKKLAENIKTSVAAPKIRAGKTGAISKEQEEKTRTPEFRISGKRFTFDAYVMNELTSPQVGSDENPRNLPEGTDVMAVLGSRAAREIAAENDGFENYSANLKNFQKLAAKPDERGGLPGDTAYYLWLRALHENFADSGSRQFFYKNVAWQWKKLMTASASWAELKHDTVLYAKQSGAEMGDGGYYAARFAPPAPRGYVEPDPQTFYALAAGANRLVSLFREFPLEDEPGEYQKKLEEFAKLCEIARGFAEKEVHESPLTLEDYDAIKKLAYSFRAQLLLPQGRDYDYEFWEDLKMALVSDVATDFVGGRVLHAATGTPRAVYVFVNDSSGGPRIARGYVYSYYEFQRSSTEGRMTDEEWKKLVYDEKKAGDLLKLHPRWYGNFEPK